MRSRLRVALRQWAMSSPRGDVSANGSTTKLPEAIRYLVLDDERSRNDLCWSVFHF